LLYSWETRGLNSGRRDYDGTFVYIDPYSQSGLQPRKRRQVSGSNKFIDRDTSAIWVEGGERGHLRDPDQSRIFENRLYQLVARVDDRWLSQQR